MLYRHKDHVWCLQTVGQTSHQHLVLLKDYSMSSLLQWSTEVCVDKHEIWLTFSRYMLIPTEKMLGFTENFLKNEVQFHDKNIVVSNNKVTGYVFQMKKCFVG